jgi:hypothetical protein
MKTNALLLSMLLGGIVFLSVEVFLLETKKRELKEDLIELSKVKYGLFNVDEWKNVLATVITKKIDDFNLTGTNKEKIRAQVSGFLQRQLNEMEDRFYEENSKTVVGFFVKNSVASLTGIFKRVRKDIPKLTEEILDFLNDPRNKKAIKAYLIDKLNTYAGETFADVDYSKRNSIVAKHGFENSRGAIEGLQNKITELDTRTYPFKVALLILGFATGLIAAFAQTSSRTDFLFLTLIGVCFLVSGLMLPMIEIDARIAEMNFRLLGESVTFKDQVLYYKSKSILEVVSLMVTQSRIDLLFVGLLVLTFSVVFPASKLIALVVYLYIRKLQQNKLIRFMIFKTGKWSMADVMVIAIFMAYIGFSGIIIEQLKQIESISENIDMLTTNRSSLLTGFFTFTAFAILSLLTSHKLQYSQKMPFRGDNNEVISH